MDETEAFLERPAQDFDLTCWYLNQRRVMELIGSDYLTSATVRHASALGDAFQMRLVLLTAAKNALVEWMQKHEPRTLGQLLLSTEATPGRIFTHYSDFYGVGLLHRKSGKGASSSDASPYLHRLVKGLGRDVRLRLRYHPEHLTASSSYTVLSGHTQQLFVFAVVEGEREGVLDAMPYVIATLLPDLDHASPTGMRWGKYREVFVDHIDTFSLARFEPIPRRSELALLRAVPEREVKRAFAEIIGEPTIPKDWGGEQSDLFSSFVRLDGRRISTAFAFKGPAKFAPLTMAGLGKNGDQIDRLFSEPAELLVLQHCHAITAPVRNAMRAYATRISDVRLFCLVDGYDTLRVLRAYSRCGFTPTPPSERDLLQRPWEDEDLLGDS